MRVLRPRPIDDYGQGHLMEPYWQKGDIAIFHGDCVEVMGQMEPGSIDALVCDPPYEINFMGRGWDNAGVAFDPDTWRAALRVLKPGGHLLAFGATRTYHRMAVAIEDAGFEIRDSIHWMYGTGFPKSMSVAKALRKQVCQSNETVQHAALISPFHPLALPGAKAPIALALVEMQPEGDLGVAIQTGEEGGSSAVMVTSWSEWAMTTNLSIASLWSGNSAASWDQASKSIIATATDLTIDPRTLKFLISPHMRPTTTKAEMLPGGCQCCVATVAHRLSDGEWNLSATQMPIALASVTVPLAPLAGLGTAAKPAHEPIIMARKPLVGTIAANVLAHGTGALNIDGCRVGWGSDGDRSADRKARGYTDQAKKALGSVVASESATGFSGAVVGTDSSTGRWPANVILSHAEGCEQVGTRTVGSGERRVALDGESQPLAPDSGWNAHSMTRGGQTAPESYGTETIEAWACVEGCPVAELDRQSGTLTSGKPGTMRSGKNTGAAYGAESRAPGTPMTGYGDSGGASRFFYVTKPSKAERNRGLGDERNPHPTVKPVALMRYLIRMVTPPGGVVLDPFLGSGTTGIAAMEEGFRFVGIEREGEYAELAKARISGWHDVPASSTDRETAHDPCLFCALAAHDALSAPPTDRGEGGNDGNGS